MNWNELFNNNGKSDLAKVKRIIRSLKLDFKKIKIFSIVGTNGKGSVSNYLAQGFVQANKKVGLFTSPHLFHPNERIKVNDVEISDFEVQEIMAKHPEFKNLIFFSTMFLVALIHFINKGVDVIILEAGIGGLRDSTNAVKADYGVVTSIDVDHEALLGSNVQSIARDKSGIINRGMKFYIPTELKTNIRDIFINKVLRTQAATFKIINNSSNSYIERNKLLAQNILKLSSNIIVDTSFFKSVPGRMEIIKATNGSLNIYDVGHNLAAIKATLEELKYQKINIDNVVIGMLKRKEKKGIKELFRGKNVYIYKVNEDFYSGKEWNIREIEDFEQQKLEGNTLFIGSFYFIGGMHGRSRV